jgi:hypothetical protein
LFSFVTSASPGIITEQAPMTWRLVVEASINQGGRVMVMGPYVSMARRTVWNHGDPSEHDLDTTDDAKKLSCINRGSITRVSDSPEAFYI